MVLILLASSCVFAVFLYSTGSVEAHYEQASKATWKPMVFGIILATLTIALAFVAGVEWSSTP